MTQQESEDLQTIVAVLLLEAFPEKTFETYKLFNDIYYTVTLILRKHHIAFDSHETVDALVDAFAESLKMTMHRMLPQLKLDT
jgi:hypothetical protein